MDTWVDWTFGIGYLITMLVLAFAIGAGIMWGGMILGVSPYMIGGFMSLGYIVNAAVKVLDRVQNYP
jgi:hypothetical protein